MPPRQISLVKNRMREICTSGTVRGEGGNVPTYSAQDRRLGDTGSSQDRPQARAAVGETGQRRDLGSANRVELPANQRHEVGIGAGHSPEDLPTASLGFDVADPNLQMPLAILAAANEGRSPR